MVRPWRSVERVHTDDGLLELLQRNENDFLITIDGRVLMNSRSNRSELLLAELACGALKNRKDPRVLIGGLGMGCTLEASLAVLPAGARVVVAELNPTVVQWCRGPLAGLTGGAVDDPRVAIETVDVACTIRNSAVNGGDSRFDAIILDLYEGPGEAASGRSDHLYGTAALALSDGALTPGGVFAVWSEDPDAAFERRLAHTGFTFKLHRPDRGSRHAVYIARKHHCSPSQK